jgi:hypothetical protein
VRFRAASPMSMKQAINETRLVFQHWTTNKDITGEPLAEMCRFISEETFS